MFEHILYWDIDCPCFRVKIIFYCIHFKKDMYKICLFKYFLSLPWMSGQNEQWDWGVWMFVDGEIRIRKENDFSNVDKSEMLQMMSSNLRDEGWLFALLYIVKWTEKCVSYWDIILNKKRSIIIKNFVRLI